MMPHILFVYILFLFVYPLSAQIELPEDKVKCSFQIEQKGSEATITALVKCAENWHINAVKLPKGSFGFPTSMVFKKSAAYKLKGGTIEPKPIERYDEITDEQLAYHTGSFQLKQKINVLSKQDFTLQGSFSFQPCDEVKCLPDHSIDFTLKVKGVEEQVPGAINNGSVQDTLSSEVTLNDTIEKVASAEDGQKQQQFTEKGDQRDLSENLTLWGIFILSFMSGLVALFTPCVLPMIPMTVSYFTKQSKTRGEGIRKAFIYGLSIILIYIVLGTAVTAIFGEEALNNMSTNPWFNFFFFLLLIVFAISFLGAFEIRLPNSWVNKADAHADKGGLIGIFFMALVLALVSFSCTGPIVGTLIVEAARHGGITPIVGMFGFSLALALPFGLFAAFPGWMNSMPKSGGWLNSVKVVLGFLELALAFKFLSNADMTWDLHLLERELFLAIWIAIFLVLALYLLGVFHLSHDNPTEKISVGRALLGTSSLILVIYMLPGMWGAPLRILSAFPPPPQYSESVGTMIGSNAQSKGNGPKGSVLGPQNIWLFHDYNKALAYAKKVKKPLLVDFTGINCVNCRKMEQKVWGQKGIIERLRNDVVIASLHVDERGDLPATEKGEFEVYPGKMMSVETTGDKWKMMQIKRYNILAQPYYVMHDLNGNDLSNGSADYEHTSNPQDFKKWLDEGIELFNEKK
jgi:thiol:disulfide interchange protein